MKNRKFLYGEDIECLDALIDKLQELALYARVNGHVPPAMELQTDRDLTGFDVYEETLSDQSTQLVVMFR